MTEEVIPEDVRAFLLRHTAVGNVVNLAARLCAEAADRQILVDPEAAQAVSGKMALVTLGVRRVKGYDMPIVVHDAGAGEAYPEILRISSNHTEVGHAVLIHWLAQLRRLLASSPPRARSARTSSGDCRNDRQSSHR